MRGNKAINDEFERTALMDDHDRRPQIGVALIVLGLILLAVLMVASGRTTAGAQWGAVEYAGMTQADNQTTFAYRLAGQAITWSLSLCSDSQVVAVEGCKQWSQKGARVTCWDGMNVVAWYDVGVTLAGLQHEGWAVFSLDDQQFNVIGPYCEAPTAVDLASFETVTAGRACHVCFCETATRTMSCKGTCTSTWLQRQRCSRGL